VLRPLRLITPPSWCERLIDRKVYTTITKRGVGRRVNARYLSQLDSADRGTGSQDHPAHEKIATRRQEIQCLNALNTLMMQTEDKQISLTDSDARSMATSGRGTGWSAAMCKVPSMNIISLLRMR
jgi:hypothetical protein